MTIANRIAETIADNVKISDGDIVENLKIFECTIENVAGNTIENVVENWKIFENVDKNAVENSKIFETVDENSVKNAVKNVETNANENANCWNCDDLRIFERVDRDK